MFKKSFMVALIASAAVSTANAADVNGYLFGSVGQAEADLFDDINGAGASIDEKDTAFKIGAGVQLNSYVGVEFQYSDLGEVRASNAVAEASAATEGYGVNLVGTLPLDRFSLFGKVGYHKLDTDVSLRVFDDSATGTDDEWAKSYGLGASFAFTPTLAAVAEYEKYRDVANEFDIELVSAGLRYNF